MTFFTKKEDNQSTGTVYVETDMSQETRDVLSIAYGTVLETISLNHLNKDGRYTQAIENQLRVVEEILSQVR